MRTEEPERKGLLHGTRILDLANEEASFCSKVLVDLGARVIKVERPGGDRSRGGEFLSGHSPPGEPCLSFLYNNANKLDITLDIEKDEGRELFIRLAKRADVVVENFPSGYLKALGCPYEVMSRANPGLILASVTGFGQKGPRSKYKSCDLVASAFGGQMYVSGSPSAPPLRAWGEQSFYLASLFAAVGILLALIRRRKAGKGEHIDISSHEAVAGTLDHVLVRYLYDGVIPKRQGNLSWNRLSFILPCKNGHMHMNIATQWETLVEWVASEGMAEDLPEEKWKNEDYRNQNVDHIIDVLQRWVLTHNVEELFEMAQAMRFPWAPVTRPEDVLSSPQLLARGFFRTMDYPERGKPLLAPGMPYRFDGPSLCGMMRRAPSPGEDNRRIYCDDLGLSEKEIARLSQLGVI